LLVERHLVAVDVEVDPDRLQGLLDLVEDDRFGFLAEAADAGLVTPGVAVE
jgi:hypothetical protein